MNNGDKIICKKKYISPADGKELFTVGEEYEIFDAGDTSISVFLNVEAGFKRFRTKPPSSAVRISHPDLFLWDIFSEYFYSIQELRKLKLNKLKT